MADDLFETMFEPQAPLAEILRPKQLEDIVGQSHLVGEGKPLSRLVAQKQLHSMLFWGPPGTGKTTLSKILSQTVDAQLINLSAVLAGVKDIREAIVKAEAVLPQRTVLFVDEIHRFNKSQQDAFLPHLESGLITLIGATTENPSFALNNALLSRSKVYVLKSITSADLLALLQRSLSHEKLNGMTLYDAQQQVLVQAADGDARKLLGLLEILVDYVHDGAVNDEDVALVTSGQTRRFDKGGDEFYEQISALHKCVRSSHPDAALYWLARMLDGGCDARYIARRVLRMASEEVGNADPRAMSLCLDAWQTYERLGSPEGALALAHAVSYLASCPKSNAVYAAFKLATAAAKAGGTQPVPMHLRNAPTDLMKDQGYGQGYQYDHDTADGIAYDQTGFPDAMGEQIFYQPVQQGLEKQISDRLNFIREKRVQALKAKRGVNA